MKPTWSQYAMLYLGSFALGCWCLMFMAGTDVWHDSGRPDLRLMGATDADLRALAYAFYLLPVFLVGQLIATVISVKQSGADRSAGTRRAQSAPRPSASA